MWCEWQPLRCLVRLCQIKGPMGAEKLPLSRSLSFPLNNFLTSPWRYLTPRTHTHLRPSVLSLSLPIVHTEALLEAEWSTEGWRWAGLFSFRQSVYVTVCLINEWLSFIHLTDTQCSVYATVCMSDGGRLSPGCEILSFYLSMRSHSKTNYTCRRMHTHTLAYRLMEPPE